MVFNSVWSLLVLAYVGITPIYMTSIFHKLAALALNVITTIFWFAGSIALAVAIGGPYNCGANTYCGSEEAAIAFGFFLW
jgi:cytochrome c oxidase assembly factor CtaG